MDRTSNGLSSHAHAHDGSQGLPHVLIVCGFFPPQNNTAARRPYYMARHLADQGHRVTVVTTETVAADWPAILDGIQVLRFPVSRTMPGGSIIDRTLFKAYRWLNGLGYDRAARLVADVFLPLDMGARLDLDLEQVERRVGVPDIVVSTGGPWSMFEFGHRAKKKWHSTFVVDYRDPWNVVVPAVGLQCVTYMGKGPAGMLRRRRMLRDERRYTFTADGVTAVTKEVLVNALRIIGGRRSQVVYNAHLPTTGLQPRSRNPQLTLVYTGAVYREQEWALLQAGLDRLRSSHPRKYADLDIALIGTMTNVPVDRQAMETLAKAHSCVRVVARMERDQVLRIQQAADLLLHVGFKGKEGILPLKFLEYIHSGVPIVQVGTGHDLQRWLLVRTRTGMVADTPDRVRDVLVAAHGFWEIGERQPYDPDPAALAEFTWEVQMEQMRSFIMDIHQGNRKA